MALVLGSGSAGVAMAQGAQAVRVPPGNGAPATGGLGGDQAGATSTTPRYGPPEAVRQRDAQMSASVPAQYKPPTGMCRVWVHGVPPAQQPAPTECAKAVRVRSPNSQVVFGSATSTSPHSEGGVVAAPDVFSSDHLSGGQAVQSQAATVTHTVLSAPVQAARSAPPQSAPSVSRPASTAVSHPTSVVHSSPPPHVAPHSSHR